MKPFSPSRLVDFRPIDVADPFCLYSCNGKGCVSSGLREHRYFLVIYENFRPLILSRN